MVYKRVRGWTSGQSLPPREKSCVEIFEA